MIGLALLAGGIIAGVGIIAIFWKSIQKWMLKVIEKVKTVVKGVIEGARIFFSRFQGVGKEISKNYAKVGMKWKETVVERKVDISEIPKEYLERMQEDELPYDFTNELQNQLQTGD